MVTEQNHNEHGRCILLAVLAALVVFTTTLSVVWVMKEKSPTPLPAAPEWNASDYQSNSDYYRTLAQRHDLTPADNLRMDQLSSPQFHPNDPSKVIYLRKQSHMPDSNGASTTLHWVDISDPLALITVQLTRPKWDVHDQQFHWVDNNTILFLSNRGSSGLYQIFQLNLPADVSKLTGFIEPVQITHFPLNIANLLVNRQATRLAFSCQVYANLTIEQTANRLLAEKYSVSLVYKFDKLLIRFWDEYLLGLRHHPFLVSLERDARGTFKLASKPVDVLFGIDSDSPSRLFSDGKSQWSFSATGDSFAFTRQYDERSPGAWSLNSDIYTVNLTKMPVTPVCLTCANLAVDTHPNYSPVDDNILVYLAQSVPGHGSDQVKLKLHDGTTTRTLLDDWDRSIEATLWLKNGQSLLVELGEQANRVLYQVIDVLTSNITVVRRGFANGSHDDVTAYSNDEQTLLFTYANLAEPKNIFVQKGAVFSPITSHNSMFVDRVRWTPTYESFSFAGARGETVWGWHMPPVNGTARKAPLAFLIHGGPQSSWYNNWSQGWNFQSFAAQGYAVIAINFHGSDSYGQNFTDSIIGEYGTLPFEDLQLGLTAALAKYPYIDGSRAVALGVSYGGFMINCIAGRPEMSRRFRALVNHAGVFDLREMVYVSDGFSTIEHDASGFAPYENPAAFEKLNPVNHVANWTQPMLVSHGGRDYRVPDTQSIAAFTVLQRRGIPSRLLYFPKENHSILNPSNALVWYREIFEWMSAWTQ